MSAQESSPGGVAVLVVDDDRDTAEAVEECLKRAGHAVSVASDGVVALRQLAEQPFSVVVTDRKMPGLSGLELAAKIQEDGYRVIVVLMSGYEPTVELPPGVWAQLLKPFVMEELISVVQRAAEHWHSRFGVRDR